MKTFISPSKSPETTTSPESSFPLPVIRNASRKKYLLGIFTLWWFSPTEYSLQEETRDWSEETTRHHRTVSFYGFVIVVPVFPRSDCLKDKKKFCSRHFNLDTHLRHVVCAPEKDALVFRASTDVSTIRREAGLDLTGQVCVAFILADHTEIPKIVQSDPAVIACDQDPVFRGHRLNSRHFPAPAVLTPRALDVNSSVILQLVRWEENNPSVVCPNNNKFTCENRKSWSRIFCTNFTVLTVGGCGD